MEDYIIWESWKFSIDDRGERWTKEMDNELIELFPKMKTKYIAEYIERTVRSVSHRAHLLGLKKDPVFFPKKFKDKKST